MSVELTDVEIAAMLSTSHTGIVTTLRADGMPVSLPVWFTVIHGLVHFRTPGQTKKVRRLANDPRCCFLVESGTKWAELKAVMITGAAELVDDEDVQAAFDAAMAQKYGGARTAPSKMPDVTRMHYATPPRLYRIRPETRGPVTWDNAKIRLREG
jgi:PPOX class probable F420-dependent enzyme